MPHAVIFANREMRSSSAARRIAGSADLLIAADGGLAHLLQLDLVPNLLIGDLDSASPEQVVQVEDCGCEVHRYPVDKDETDLELALMAAVNSGCERITVIAGLGGRLDQTLANIHLLGMPQFTGIDVRLDDGEEEVFQILDQAVIHGAPGDILSLLPISATVHGISTFDLKYPLNQEDLQYHQSRGISNVMLKPSVRIKIESGVLLCIHTRKEVLK